MKRRPGPLAGRAEAARHAKAITIWNEILLADRGRGEPPPFTFRADPRQLQLPFDEMPRQRQRRDSGPTNVPGAAPAPWQDGGG